MLRMSNAVTFLKLSGRTNIDKRLAKANKPRNGYAVRNAHNMLVKGRDLHLTFMLLGL